MEPLSKSLYPLCPVISSEQKPIVISQETPPQAMYELGIENLEGEHRGVESGSKEIRIGF